MDKLVVKGGARLRGAVDVSGAKNVALPLLAATLLADGRSVLRNAPDVGDVWSMRQLLADLGATVEARGATVSVDTAKATRHAVVVEMGEAKPSAILLLGPLLARHGEARIDGLAPSPDRQLRHTQPLRGLQALGARITHEGGTIHAEARRLRGATFAFEVVTAADTATMMMAAALAHGRTTLENCACEPEVEELGRVLNKMGGKVHGAGTPLVTIEGVDNLDPIEHAIIPDRIEAGTLMVAAAITRGDLLLRNCAPEHLGAVIGKLRAAGVEISVEADGLRVRGGHDIAPADIVTRPYPGFPSDLGAVFLVLMTRARGESVLTETGLGNQFRHAAELVKLGADVTVTVAGAGAGAGGGAGAGTRSTALVRGPSRLKGATVMANDVVGSASLVLAGLVAEGTTEILQIWHLDRGYERLDRKLRAVGADIRRTRGGPEI